MPLKSLSLSVCTHEVLRGQRDGFSCDLSLGKFTEICHNIKISHKITVTLHQDLLPFLHGFRLLIAKCLFERKIF
jgi:hypothetical protein